MSSIQKLIYHWKQGQFIPGGKPPPLLNNEVKEQRLSELVGDDVIVQDSLKGISIFKDVVEAFKITQEFRKDPASFSGDARDVLMSDDFLLVADVLRLIIPEGMISKVWQLKRRRDDDLGPRDNDHAPGNRRILIPKSRRLDILEEEESMNSGPENRQHKAGYKGIFGTPVSQIRFTNGSKAQETTDLSGAKAGYKGIFGTPVSQIRFTNGSKAQETTDLSGAEAGYKGIFGTPVSQIRFTNGSKAQETTGPLSGAEAGYKGIFGTPVSQIGFTNGPKAQETAGPLSGAEAGYKGIFGTPVSQIGFTNGPKAQEITGPLSGASSGPEATGYKGIFGTGNSIQQSSSLPGNKEEAILDHLISSMGGNDMNKLLAQLQLHQQGRKRKHEEEEEIMQLHQQGIKRKHEEEEEGTNKKQNTGTSSLIEF